MWFCRISGGQVMGDCGEWTWGGEWLSRGGERVVLGGRREGCEWERGLGDGEGLLGEWRE